MSLRRLGQTKRRFWAGSIVLLLAIAVLGLGGGRQAAAQLDDPRRLLDIIKKKGNTKTVPNTKQNAGSKKQLPGIFRGKKDTTKTAVPKNLPKFPGKNQTGNNQRGKNLFGKGQDGNAGKTTISKATNNNGKLLNKGIDSKNGKKGTVGNIGNGKNAKSAIGKDGKGIGNRAALGKGTGGPKANSIFGKGNTPKGIAQKGFNNRAVLRGPLRAATPVQRLRLRTDHRRELLTVRRLLPVHLLPGQRGFHRRAARGRDPARVQRDGVPRRAQRITAGAASRHEPTRLDHDRI